MDAFLPDPNLVWGLFPRLVGLLNMFAFVSLLSQSRSFFTSSPVSPDRFTTMMRANFGLWTRVSNLPSLLWLNASGRFSMGLALLGVACGLLAFGGSAYAPAALLACWLLYLSLDSGRLSYPWDQLLVEVTFLAALFPAAPLLPHVSVTQAPPPLLAFAAQFLVARLMLGFAKVKFVGTSASDGLYLKAFFAWMPMPNRLGLRLYHLPGVFHRASLAFMFFAEVVCPLLTFVPGWPRLVGAAGLVALMLGIQLTGNWGFFNLAYIAVSVCFLDQSVDVLTAATTLFSPPDTATALRNVIACGLIAGGAFHLLALNSWVNRSWIYLPLFEKLTERWPWMKLFFDPLRALVALRICNAYGVFPPQVMPATRLALVFEGTRDGETWHRYPYRYLPCAETFRPRNVAPHHPRFEQALPYIAAGLGDGGLTGSLIGTGLPTVSFSRYAALAQRTNRLLTEPGLAGQTFAQDPLDGALPAQVRVTLKLLSPTCVTDQKSGNWWSERHITTVVRATEAQPIVAELAQPFPETMHPDALYWKNRARPLREMCAVFDATSDVHAAVCAASTLKRDDVQRFWTDVVPLLNGARRTMREHGAAAVWADEAAYAARFTERERAEFERIAMRLSWLLRYAMKKASPRTDPLIRYPAFRCALVRYGIIAEGEATYARATTTPAAFRDRFAQASNADAASAARYEHLAVLMMLRPSSVEGGIATFRYAQPNFGATQRLPSVFQYGGELAAIPTRDEKWCPVYRRETTGFYHLIDSNEDGAPAP